MTEGRTAETVRSGASPRYYAHLDFEKLWADYPPAPDYFEGAYLRSRDEIRSVQEERFLRQMKRAWEVPFYRKHWGAAGMAPGDVKGLGDLASIPPFSVHDLREAIARNPPWGDFIGLDPEVDDPLPLALQTSGGTTGLPRPMLYAPQDREVMNIITGRRLYMQGVRPFDIVQVTLSLGLSNGGFLAREGIWKYTGAVPVMTGSGAQTPTRRQIEIMRAWKTKHLIGFPAYLRHMGHVLRDELRIDPRSLGIKSLIVHLGVDDRATLEELWGADVYDTYGTNECGSLAAECGCKSGMHVFEDAFVLEIIDLETGAPKPPGEKGTIYQTSLFKHLAPLIRFNVNDVSAFASGECRCGSKQLRLERIYGRSDNMVKLRGTNVFPEAIGAIVAETPQSNGEYFCILADENGREDMTVLMEVADVESAADVARAVGKRLKEAVGVTLPVRVVGPGELSDMTGLNRNSKVQRLRDDRKKVLRCASSIVIRTGRPRRAASSALTRSARARSKSGVRPSRSFQKTSRSLISETITRASSSIFLGSRSSLSTKCARITTTFSIFRARTGMCSLGSGCSSVRLSMARRPSRSFTAADRRRPASSACASTDR